MLAYQKGEDYATKCLEANGYTVVDRRQSPEYWAKDIDLTAIKDGTQMEIEVKWDSRIQQSGAMFFELVTNIKENRAGWANYTEADFIFYGDAVGKVFYVFSVSDMRKYLREHKGEYETRTATDYDRRTGAVRKQSLGAIVPLVPFCQSVRVQVIDIEQRLRSVKTSD